MVSSMENANYGNVQFMVSVPKSDICTYRVTVDSTPPCKCIEESTVVHFTFALPCGRHTVEVESIPTAKNGIGKLHCTFFSHSPFKNYLNHLATFYYDIACFKMKLNINVHRNSSLNINIKGKKYVTFLNTEAEYLSPYVVHSQNIKLNGTLVELLDEKQQKKLFHYQILLWSLYCFLLLAIFIPLAVINMLNWNTDSGIAGHSGASLFAIGSFPVIILILCSYFYYIYKLYKQYKNGFLVSEI